ncbi:MAG TPA: hypothetical protein VK116_05495 [Planctomycetota bacterium]|nr:hypothetical protein [Planctomycetota bacterium]
MLPLWICQSAPPPSPESLLDKLIEPSILVPGLGILAGIVWIVAHFWHDTVRVKRELAFKTMLVEQGLSADEIERLVRVRGDSECTKGK